MKSRISIALVAVSMFVSCGVEPASQLTLSGLDPANFAAEVNGSQTSLHTLRNASGMEVCITDFGGRIVSVMVPDRDGIMRDVVLGFDNVQDYIDTPSDFGATIGRYANRIAHGRMMIDGREIQLPQNNFGHCLHGGPGGWQYKVFEATRISDTSLELTLLSPDGDENFPGNVTATVLFTLTDDNAIEIEYGATTDRTTVINMTNHSYFNLSGDPSKSVADHILWVDADSYTPVDDTFMTTGEIAPVAGTPMDFTSPKAIGRDIDDYDFAQLKNGDGYDHNYVLNTAGDAARPAARLSSPVSGITLEVFTDEPGVQVYSGNFLDGTVAGKGGVVYARRAAVCLETQHYPDSPNKPGWPSVILEPGRIYRSKCVFKFSTDK